MKASNLALGLVTLGALAAVVWYFSQHPPMPPSKLSLQSTSVV